MKSKILTLCMIVLLLNSCRDQPENDVKNKDLETEMKEKPMSLNGTWELKGFYNYKDNVVVDSFSNQTIARQVKMYSDHKVMWCKLLKTDSIEFFGYGSYSYDEGSLTEVLDFGSAFMNEVIKEQQEFKFQLKLQPDSFQQIELDEDGNRIYSENYVRVE